MQQGWIKLYRSIREGEIFNDHQLLRLWLICLTEATYKECSQLIGKQTVHLMPGEFVTGRFDIFEKYNQGLKNTDKIKGEKTVYRWLEKLESLGCVTIKKTTKYSVISIVNWSEYQQNDQQKNDHVIDHQNDHQNDQQKPNDSNGSNDVSEKSDHQNDQLNVRKMTTNKEVKEIKNINNMSGKPNASYPFDEIVNYLNAKCGKNFKPTTKATQSLIKARMNEGFTVDDFKQVIDTMAIEWKGKVFSNGTLGDNYLQPQTLFSTKFEGYLNKQSAPSTQQQATAIPIQVLPEYLLNTED